MEQGKRDTSTEELAVVILGELGKRIEDVLFDVLGRDSGLAFRERDQGRREVGVVHGVVDGDRNLETTVVRRRRSRDTGPHGLQEGRGMRSIESGWIDGAATDGERGQALNEGLLPAGLGEGRARRDGLELLLGLRMVRRHDDGRRQDRDGNADGLWVIKVETYAQVRTTESISRGRGCLNAPSICGCGLVHDARPSLRGLDNSSSDSDLLVLLAPSLAHAARQVWGMRGRLCLGLRRRVRCMSRLRHPPRSVPSPPRRPPR